MELAELTVRGFTEEIASASPAPGGGSAAALAGAVGAALTAMVSGLTLGRKKYEAVQELALRAQAQADALRKRLLAAMEQDTQTFLQVSAAYAMPKQTPEEKQARSSAIEQGLKACTQPPLAVAGQPPVVKGAGGIHEQHATGKEGGAEGVFPATAPPQAQYHPGGCQSEHHATQVGEGVEAFFACTFAQCVHVAKVAF